MRLLRKIALPAMFVLSAAAVLFFFFYREQTREVLPPSGTLIGAGLAPRKKIETPVLVALNIPDQTSHFFELGFLPTLAVLSPNNSAEVLAFNVQKKKAKRVSLKTGEKSDLALAFPNGLITADALHPNSNTLAVATSSPNIVSVLPIDGKHSKIEIPTNHKAAEIAWISDNELVVLSEIKGQIRAQVLDLRTQESRELQNLHFKSVTDLKMYPFEKDSVLVSSKNQSDSCYLARLFSSGNLQCLGSLYEPVIGAYYSAHSKTLLLLFENSIAEFDLTTMGISAATELEAPKSAILNPNSTAWVIAYGDKTHVAMFKLGSLEKVAGTDLKNTAMLNLFFSIPTPH